jgi:hypothetical protein
MARPTLPQNRKFLKLARRLGSRALARGHLELLWDAANETGNAVLGDVDDVEILGDWQGDKGELVTALMECGSAGGPGFIIEESEGIYRIHDYWDHAPRYVRRRRQREDERKSDRTVTGHEPDSDRSVTVTPNSPLPSPNTRSQHAPPDVVVDDDAPERPMFLATIPDRLFDKLYKFALDRQLDFTMEIEACARWHNGRKPVKDPYRAALNWLKKAEPARSGKRHKPKMWQTEEERRWLESTDN